MEARAVMGANLPTMTTFIINVTKVINWLVAAIGPVWHLANGAVNHQGVRVGKTVLLLYKVSTQNLI